MPKLPVLSGQEVRRVLESYGFQLVRQRGSHMVMQQVVEGGTLRSIIRQSGLAVEVFRK